MEGKLEFRDFHKRNEEPNPDRSIGWAECKLTPLPGVEIVPKNHPEFRISRPSPTHVRIDRSGIGSSEPKIDITVIAPMAEIDVALNAAFGPSGKDHKIVRFLSLSPYGPELGKYRTHVMLYRKSGEEGKVRVKPSLQDWGVTEEKLGANDL